MFQCRVMVYCLNIFGMAFGAENTNVVELSRQKREKTPAEQLGRKLSAITAPRYESLIDEILSLNPELNRDDAWSRIRKAETTNNFFFFDEKRTQCVEEIARLQRDINTYEQELQAIRQADISETKRQQSYSKLLKTTRAAKEQRDRLLKEKENDDTSQSVQQLIAEEKKSLRALQEIGIATKGERKRLEELEKEWPEMAEQTG